MPRSSARASGAGSMRPRRGLGQHRGAQQRALGRRGQLGDARCRQGAHVVGHRQAGVGGVLVVDDQPRHLQGIERVAARRLGDAREHRARQRASQPIGDHPPQRAQGQRAEAHAPHAVTLDGVQQAQPGRLGTRRAQHAHRLGVQAPDGEGEDAGGGPVQPLGVVERQEHGGVTRQLTDEGQQCRRHQAGVERRALRRRAQQRHLQGVALQVRERRE